MGGGKSSTTTSQVSIPPEVMARYNAVNARAEDVAKTPFQPYQGQFVAGITPTQQQGIQRTSEAATMAQPYYQAATGQLQQAYGQGYEQTQQAYQPLQQGYGQGQQYANQAAGQYGQAYQAAQPYYQAATENVGAGLGLGSVANLAATQQALAAPYAAAPAQQFAQGQIMGAQQQAAPANMAAMRQALGAARQSQPYYQAATQGIGQALAGGQPYQGLATNAAMAGSEAITPQNLNLQQFMNPYTQQVADTTYQALRQQQQQEMAGQTANAIRSGAFGGDRAGLAAANLARQQSLATAQAMAPIYQQGFGQALAAAQQQQGVNLAAEQANRAAQQQLAQQALAIGQQGYGQQMTAAQQQAALGQALYGQGIQGAQTLSGLGQTQYGQALGAGTAAGQLGQQLYGQGAAQAQLLSGLGQTAFGQNLTAAQQQAALGQAQAGLGMQYGQALQGLGQQQFAQGQGMSAQQAALAQQGYGMGAGTAQAMAGLGTGAQGAALQGAQAQIGAGTLEQQTRQADLTAQYQQFLQERGFPYQQAQFLANIAMGTGALSGSTTTTQQPAGFFSDERLKEDAQQIGKTNDGQPIYRFRYKGDPRYQIGLMAQDVAEDHPEAVGKHGDYLTVDYKVATDDAVKKAEGGVVPNWMGGAVEEPGFYAHGGLVPRQGYATDGAVGDSDFMKAILQSQMQAFSPIVGGSVYGGAGAGTPFAKSEGYVPKATLPVSKLATAASVGGGGRGSGLEQAASTGKNIAELLKMGEQGYAKTRQFFAPEETKAPPKPTKGGTETKTTAPVGGAKADTPSTGARPVSYESGQDGYFIPAGESASSGVMPFESDSISMREVEPEDIFFASGGVVPRLGYAGLGKVIDPYETQDPSEGVSAYIKDATESSEDTSDDKIGGTGSGGGAGKGRSGMDDIKDIAGIAGTAVSLGKTAASAIPAILSVLPFSDARLKDNIEKVGKLNDGQNVYRYDFGNGRTQIGLLAQEVLKKKPDAVGKRDGYMTVDYDKATEGAIKRAMGGLARQGYATEGAVDPDEELIQKFLPVNEAAESGGRNIGNPRSSAFGVHQFTKGTWNDLITRNPDLGLTAEDRMTEEGQRKAAPVHARELIASFRNQGIEPSHEALRYGWSLGSAGGPTFYKELQEDPSRPAVESSVATPAVVKANPTWFYNKDGSPKTIGEMGQLLASAGTGRGGGGGQKGLVPDADMPSEKATPVQYDGGDAASGFSLPGTSGSFWVPALSMVGSMLASRNPTLGGAIGEGVVGGVAGYQAQQRLNADLAKNVLDIVRDRFNVTTDQRTGETRYFNKNTGELLNPAQYKQVVAGIARGLNVDPAVLGITNVQPAGGYQVPGGGGQRVPTIQAPGQPQAPTSPGAAPQDGATAPAGGAPATTEQQPVQDITRLNKAQLEEVVKKEPKKFGLDGDKNPNYLTQQITERRQRALNASNQGNTAEASRLDAEANELETRRNQYLNDAVDLQYKTNLSLQEAQTKGYNDYLTDAQKRAVAYQNVRKDMKRLADIYSQYEPNRAAELKTQVTDFLSGLGFDVFNNDYQNASFDEAMKIALMQAAKSVDELGLTRAPGAALQNTLKTVPAPTLVSGAAYTLIGRTLGDLDYWANVDKKFLEQPRGTSPAEFLIKYRDKFKDESPEKYTRQAFENEVRPGPGVSRQTIESVRRSYGVERIPGMQPTTQSGAAIPAGGQGQQQTQQPAAPAIPEPLRGMEGLVYSPSRNQYRDAQGNIYDATGRRVQ